MAFILLLSEVFKYKTMESNISPKVLYSNEKINQKIVKKICRQNRNQNISQPRKNNNRIIRQKDRK